MASVAYRTTSKHSSQAPSTAVSTGSMRLSRRTHVDLHGGDRLTTPLAAHGLGHYVAGARTAEESTDPSVRRAVAGVREFLGGRSDETTTWVISRAAA